MYSPTTRLWTVLELLQSYKQMKGAEIARRLEVDGRTVRRYIGMLQDMGIPVEGERGPYGAYHLTRGYKLPPLMFTDAEAVALTLGLLAIREFRFPVDAEAVEGALAKTERVMPEKLLQQARSLQEAITFNISAPPFQPESHYVATISSAVQRRQQVLLRYKAWGGSESERAFDPYGILFNDGYWYTSGYCHLRSDLRTFRLDRIVKLEPLAESFERPAAFDVLDHVLRSIVTMPGTDQVEVLLKTTLERARQFVTEDFGVLQETAEGVLFRRSASQLDWIAIVLINMDFPVVVRSPESLRQRIRQLAARAAQIVSEDR